MPAIDDREVACRGDEPAAVSCNAASLPPARAGIAKQFPDGALDGVRGPSVLLVRLPDEPSADVLSDRPGPRGRLPPDRRGRAPRARPLPVGVRLPVRAPIDRA